MAQPLATDEYLTFDDTNEAIGGITTPSGVYISYHTLFVSISKIICTPLSVIHKYIPPVPQLRGNKTFHLLIAINSRPSCSAHKLTVYLATDSRIINKMLDRLIELGFIYKCKRPRKLPFGPYKLDDVYRSTSKGRNVLRRIIQRD